MKPFIGNSNGQVKDGESVTTTQRTSHCYCNPGAWKNTTQAICGLNWFLGSLCFLTEGLEQLETINRVPGCTGGLTLEDPPASVRLIKKGGNTMLSKKTLDMLSNLCFVLGFVSILGSIFMWWITRGDGSIEALAHAERFGIFVGLWAPTFFIISSRLDRYADKAES